METTAKLFKPTDKTLGIGETGKWKISLDLPEVTTDLTIRVEVPVGIDQALLTINNIDVTYAGSSIGCPDCLRQHTEGMSYFSTSQNNSAQFNIGLVTNIGNVLSYQQVILICHLHFLFDHVSTSDF